MSLIFDGNVPVFSTCRTCRTVMQVTDPDQTVHPHCAGDVPPSTGLRTGLLSTILAGDTEATALTAKELATHGLPSHHKAATWYASMRWPVFGLRPVGTRCDGGDKCAEVCQCPKKPATRNGFKDATTSADHWVSHPTHNIGLATGAAFDVVDVDIPEGIPSLLKLLTQQRIPDVHGIAVTASGGLHLYIKPTGKGNRAAMLPGIDFRAVGGYVVAPPSTLGDQWWQWLVVPSPGMKK